MKKLIFAVILSLILIFGCVLVIFTVRRTSENVLLQLEEIENCGRENRLHAAAENAEKALKYWESKTDLLEILLRHDEVDKIGQDLSAIRSYAQTEDYDDFMALCASVRMELLHIQKSELPKPENIL